MLGVLGGLQELYREMSQLDLKLFNPTISASSILHEYSAHKKNLRDSLKKKKIVSHSYSSFFPHLADGNTEAKTGRDYLDITHNSLVDELGLMTSGVLVYLNFGTM